MSLVKHAKRELELYGAFKKDEKGGVYGGMLGEAVMELIETFAKQGHSGMSASIVRQLFHKLADYKPLCPLTLKDDEWNNTGDDTYQNIRNSAVFKDGKDGKPYYISAHYQKTQTGSTWNGSLSIGDGTRLRHCYIKDTSKMPKICIDVIDWEVNKDTGKKEPGSGWWLHKMKDKEQLKELAKYYELEIVKED